MNIAREHCEHQTYFRRTSVSATVISRIQNTNEQSMTFALV